MRFKNENDYSVFIIYFVISLFLLGIDSLGWLSGVRSVGDKVINPVSQVVRSTSQSILKPIQMVRFMSSGPQRILDLESRYAEAIVSLEEMESLKTENQSLRKLLGYNPDDNFSYQPISVVGGSSEVVLAAGSVSGIGAGATVIDSSNALLGRVSRVSPYTSWVITPKYQSSKIPVIIGVNKIPSVLVRSNQESLVEVEQASRIFVGDYIFTSGINGDYVPNILIGRVSQVEEESASVYKKIIVDLLSSPGDTVFVVGSKK